jgi:hypothetical protein
MKPCWSPYGRKLVVLESSFSDGHRPQVGRGAYQIQARALFGCGPTASGELTIYLQSGIPVRFP